MLLSSNALLNHLIIQYSSLTPPGMLCISSIQRSARNLWSFLAEKESQKWFLIKSTYFNVSMLWIVEVMNSSNKTTISTSNVLKILLLLTR